MYDSIHKTSQPSMQSHHMEFAQAMVNNISEFTIEQQNEVLLTVFKTVKDRRKSEVHELNLRNEEINERRALIQNMEERLQKEMEQVRVS